MKWNKYRNQAENMLDFYADDRCVLKVKATDMVELLDELEELARYVETQQTVKAKLLARNVLNGHH